MTIRYLLDTNVISEGALSSPDPVLVGLIQQLWSEIAISATVLHEMLYGAARLPPSARRRWVEAYIDDVLRGGIPILPYDQTAARWHALERARLTAVGLTPSDPDAQIAAVAATNGLILVTSNTADFRHFIGLRLEDWRV
ncbi:MAG: type II toxin-antitoxin system VapC family toxin [Chloroflexi bacterium]|nr:type II toxin-antitoxin system VapC family toxin [Chloroflexota bacterium]